MISPWNGSAHENRLTAVTQYRVMLLGLLMMDVIICEHGAHHLNVMRLLVAVVVECTICRHECSIWNVAVHGGRDTLMCLF